MRTIVGALLVAVSFQCHAKCANVEASITGRVEDGSAHSPIAGALIVVSFIDYKTARSAIGYSNRDGEFNLTFRWIPLSGEGMRGDICEVKLEFVTAQAFARGFRSSEDSVRITDLTGRTLFRLERETK